MHFSLKENIKYNFLNPVLKIEEIKKLEAALIS